MVTQASNRSCQPTERSGLVASQEIDCRQRSMASWPATQHLLGHGHDVNRAALAPREIEHAKSTCAHQIKSLGTDTFLIPMEAILDLIAPNFLLAFLIWLQIS